MSTSKTETKTCPKCGKEKGFAEFHKKSSSRDGLQSRCKPCLLATNKIWREANPELQEAARKQWSDENPNKRRQYRRNYTKKYPEKISEQNHRQNLRGYGLSVEEYDRLLIAQAGGCAICGIGPGKRRLYVDHSHATGHVRGLLCNRHNLAVGFVQDNPEVARKLAEYLEKKSPAGPEGAGEASLS